MLIITGTIAYDYIMDFPGNFAKHILPDQIHKINLSFIVQSFAKRSGGTAGNVSYTLSLLQTPSLLFSVAGKDFDEYKKKFTLLPVDISHILIRQEEYTATGFAMTDASDNQIWGYYYGAAEWIKSLQLKTVVKKNDFVLIGPSGAEGSMSFVRQCIAQKIPYMFDPGFILTQITDENLLLGVINAAYVIGNDYEIAVIQKRLPGTQLFDRKRCLITTLGAKGCRIQTAQKSFHVPAVPVSETVDPTGAGDAFRGGFLAGIEKQKDLKTSAQIGSVAASFAVEKYGTQEHVYSLAEFNTRYRQAFGSLVL